MLQALATAHAPAHAALNLADPPSGRLDVLALRHRAAQLVEKNQLTEALALLDQALCQSPDSQDLLAMMALVCEVRHDWTSAQKTLEHLAAVQGQNITAQTLGHLVRVIRCQGHLLQALQWAEEGARLHPSDIMLDSELKTLRSMVQAHSHQQKG